MRLNCALGSLPWRSPCEWHFHQNFAGAYLEAECKEVTVICLPLVYVDTAVSESNAVCIDDFTIQNSNITVEILF